MRVARDKIGSFCHHPNWSCVFFTDLMGSWAVGCRRCHTNTTWVWKYKLYNLSPRWQVELDTNSSSSGSLVGNLVGFSEPHDPGSLTLWWLDNDWRETMESCYISSVWFGQRTKLHPMSVVHTHLMLFCCLQVLIELWGPTGPRPGWLRWEFRESQNGFSWFSDVFNKCLTWTCNVDNIVSE